MGYPVPVGWPELLMMPESMRSPQPMGGDQATHISSASLQVAVMVWACCEPMGCGYFMKSGVPRATAIPWAPASMGLSDLMPSDGHVGCGNPKDCGDSERPIPADRRRPWSRRSPGLRPTGSS